MRMPSLNQKKKEPFCHRQEIMYPKKVLKSYRIVPLKVNDNLENDRQDFLRNLELSFSDSLQIFDSTKFRLTDTNYQLLPGARLTLNSTATKITLSYPWKANTPYVLVLDSNAVADSSGRMLAGNDTLSFSTFRESDYGSLRIRFQNLDTSLHPVLLVMQNEDIVEAAPLTSYEWYRKFFSPGEYELRMLYDTNHNGIWDPGSYNEKRQPEIVRPVTTKEGGKIVVRANLDKEYNITL